jgi:hypothetical protein
MRMTQLRDRLRLTLEAKLQLRVLGEFARQNLDGHGSIEPRIARAKDFTHTARADPGDDFIRAEAAAGQEIHDVKLGEIISEAWLGGRDNNLTAILTIAA